LYGCSMCLSEAQVFNTVIYVYFWRLFFLMQMFLVKGSIRLCPTFAFKEILKDMIPIHDIACMVWYVSSYIFYALFNNRLDQLVHIILVSYGRMLIWSCWVWLPMKSIFQFLERFVRTEIFFWISEFNAYHSKIIT